MTWNSKSFRFAIVLAGMAFSCRASDVYISQNAAGAANGSNCANSRGLSYFTSALNWSLVGAIRPGTTVHLCGTFTAPAGADGFLGFQAGGTNGNPITLVAEPGTVLQAPYWGEHGAISAQGVSFVVIDGNHNGLIQATANGTKLANQAPKCRGNLCSAGIHVSRCDNCIVRNWTIGNMYVNVPPNDENLAGEGSFGIFFNGGNDIAISGNTVHDAKWCLFFGYYPGTTTRNARIFGNTAYNCDHGVSVFSDNSGAVLNNLYIYGNVLHDGANWDDTVDNNHHDGIHISPTQEHTSLNNAYIYNNYVYGDWGINCNSFVYLAAYTDPKIDEVITNVNVFNNLLVNTSAAHTCANGLIQDFGSHNALIANNTLVGPTTAAGQGIIIEEASPYHTIVKNNILSGFQNGLYVGQGATRPDSDYNDFYNVANIAFAWGTDCCSALGMWKAQAGNPETHSLNANPNLNAAYAPQAGSPAIRSGANLTSLRIADLSADKSGAKRPAGGPAGECPAAGGSGCWDLGAYQSTAVSGATKPNPPALLKVTVQ